MKVNAKTKKGKELVQALEAGGFQISSLVGEQFGKKRYAFVTISNSGVSGQDFAIRLKAEAFLKQMGFKIVQQYAPGSGTLDVFLGYYDEKYDGFVSV